MSRNSACEIHPRRRTNSSSIIAICAAGPPNAVVPRRKNDTAISRNVCRLVMMPRRKAMAVLRGPAFSQDSREKKRKLAAEQRRLADRQFQRVAAQPIQRDLSGKSLYPLAVAA